MSYCWKQFPEPPGWHVWNNGFHPDYAVMWTGGCEDGLASGSVKLTGKLPEEPKIAGRGLHRARSEIAAGLLPARPRMEWPTAKAGPEKEGI